MYVIKIKVSIFIFKYKDILYKMKKITFYDEEKYMYVTSNLFIIPTLYGYYNNFFTLSVFNLCSTLITSKFWSTGNNDIYRKIDLIYQPINCAFFFIYGNMYAKSNLLLNIGNLFFLNGLYFYKKSHDEYKKINRYWYYNHLIFHLSMITANTLTYMAN